MALGSVLLSSPALADTASVPRPNVLFILADDLGWGDLRCYGNPYLDTPNLDALASGGVRLTAHYSPSPLCSPARAGYLTGRFNHRTGAVDVPSNRGLDRIDPSEKTFGDHFRHAGYGTALVGKWHNGVYCRGLLPHRRGFDLFFGFPNGGQDYWKWNLLHDDRAVPHDGRYLTDVINDEAIRFINAPNEKPFALFLAHHAPHSPLQAPEPLVQKYRQRLGGDASDAVAVTYAMIEAMDTGLGRVFQALKDRGLWENTITVFTSDNGPVLSRDPTLGSQRRFNGVFSGEKQDVREGGIRVPAIVAWPGHIPGGQVIATPVHGCDWLPTLLSLTGSGPPEGAKPFDGLNLFPLLLGQPAPALTERSLFFQRNRYAPVAHGNAAIREGRWKLCWPGDAASLAKDSARDNPSYLRGITRPHWEMPLDRQLDPPSTATQPPPRLYDLDADPAEHHDLAARHPEIVEALTRKHDAWFREVMSEWELSRARILDHDRAYWKDRAAPDPAALFHDFWVWKSAPEGTDRSTADPLKVFRGFWNDGEDEEALPFDPTRIDRHSLDDLPRSLSIRQGNDVWLGYDLERATVAKVWQAPAGQPGLIVSGFTTRSTGTTWFEDKSAGTWQLSRGGRIEDLTVRYLGCSQREESFELSWELRHADGALKLRERIAMSGPAAGERVVRELRVEALSPGETLLLPLAARDAWKLSHQESAPVLSGSGWHRLSIP
jgi:arylsulfatase A